MNINNINNNNNNNIDSNNLIIPSNNYNNSYNGNNNLNSIDMTLKIKQKLKKLYKDKLLPLEKLTDYEHFLYPEISDNEFDSKPHVLIIGQYSTGKTTFINYLLGKEYPGSRVGPEPTTDRFIAIMEGHEDRIIPGGALSVHPNLPYGGLEQFGVSFLNRLEGIQLSSKILNNLTFIDTPGVLSGEKQSQARGYDFVKVCSWFADHSDLIILLFDAHKLDISDEFKDVLQGLLPNREKIRCVLNKADQLDKQDLLRVHGALLWSLGKIISTPEVPRVYVGSFWSDKNTSCENIDLYLREESDLLSELNNLPSNNLLHKVNQLIQRCRQVKVHALIISYLKEQYSSQWFHKQDKKHEMIEHLANVFHSIYVNNSNEISLGDFPDLQTYQKLLVDMNWGEFHQIKNHHPELIEHVNDLLNNHLSTIIHEIQYNASNKLLELSLSETKLKLQSAQTQSSDLNLHPPPPPLLSQQHQQHSQKEFDQSHVNLPPSTQEQKQPVINSDPINHPEQIRNRYHPQHPAPTKSNSLSANIKNEESKSQSH